MKNWGLVTIHSLFIEIENIVGDIARQERYIPRRTRMLDIVAAKNENNKRNQTSAIALSHFSIEFWNKVLC